MTLVNIDPHVILHQKTHVPSAVNFFESETASQHHVMASCKPIQMLFFAIWLVHMSSIHVLFHFQ